MKIEFLKRGTALFVLLLTLPAHAASPTLAAAEAVVRAQYAAEVDSSPKAAARLYVVEIAREMTDPLRGAAVNLGIDPRYGQDNWKVENVVVSAAPGPDGQARVTVRFLNFGRPTEIDWRLVPAPDGPMGWKVFDISAPKQNDWAAFDLRLMLNLPPGK